MIREEYRDKDTGEAYITRNVVDGETTVNEIAQVTDKTTRELCKFLQDVVDSGGELPDGLIKAIRKIDEETKGEKMNRQENNIGANNKTSVTIYEGGMKVKDTMTGVEGTITAWCHYYGVETDNVRITYKSDNGVIIEDWVSVSRLAEVSDDE